MSSPLTPRTKFRNVVSDINATDNEGRTQLWVAANGGQEAAVGQLLSAPGIDVNAANNEGQTPLWAAAREGHEAVVGQLLSTPGIDVNAAGYSGLTPLWAAANGGHKTPLWAAANGGHEAVVGQLLSAPGIDVNAAGHNGQTPLWAAARKGHKVVVGQLLSAPGIDVNAANSKGYTPLWAAANGGHKTPLWAAANGGHEAVVGQLLIAPGIDVNAANNEGQTPLWTAANGGHKTPLWAAANRGHEAVVGQLLSTPGIDVNAANNEGQTPLWTAANGGHEAVVGQLLSAPGIDVNAANNEGQTPLWTAANGGREAVVGQLLSAPGIDVNAARPRFQKPPWEAAREGHKAVVGQLVSASRIVRAAGYRGQPPLWAAANRGHEAVVGQLLSTPGIDVNAAGYSRQTPLWAAANGGHKAVVGQLLSAPGIDVNAAGYSRQTPLWAATNGGHEAVVGQLLSTPRIDVNAANNEGKTPLWAAANGGHEAVVGQLLSTLGIDVNAAGYSGQTPLWAAANGGHEAVVGQLLSTPGIDVNAAGYSRQTPLWAASRKGHKAVVGQLLRAPGIDVNAAEHEDMNNPAFLLKRQGELLSKAQEKTVSRAASESQNRSTQVTFGNHNTGFQLGVGNSRVSGISFEGKGTKDTYGRTQLFAAEKELGEEVNLLVPAISQDKLRESVNSDVSPETMQSTLAGGRIEDIKRLLDQHFNAVAKEDFIWLQELREHGYETEEIAQLLATEQNDSPWIYFEPRHLPREVIIPDHHEAFCVHMGGQEVRYGTGSISSTISMDRKDYRLSWTSDNESLTYIEELCGIAGVVPNTRDLSKQVGSVKFVEEDGTLTASVSFHFDSKAEKEYKLSGHNDRALSKVAVEHSSNILQALGNLCSAIAHAQRSGICCDSFTVLQFSIISAQEVIELCHIRVTVILDLYSKFASFLANPEVKGGNIQHLMLDALDCGKGIFQEATLSSFTTATFEGILDYYSLAVQFLSLGFSSYIKAHVGAIQPFFLDTSLSVIKLFGLQDKERQSPRLTASLHRLTCLDDMIQNHVLVFGEGQAKKQETQKSYDLLASPEDLVDTWGPGQFVTSSSTTRTHTLTAIMIGGGVVKPTAENNMVLHWSSNVEPRHKFSVHFSKTEKVLIAGGVKVNTACQSNKTEIWSSFIGSLENLGTAADYWQFTEFQAGVAVMGQQFAGGQLQFNKTWTWHPGNSWKRQHLSLLADELPFNELDRPWGLQVSACTGVARRVPLRMLLADTMPTFAGNLALPSGWTTLQQRGIIEALEKGSRTLKLWYDELCNLPNFQDLQILTKRLIRYILLVLRDTGIDRDHKTFLIACPQGYLTGQPISMCLPVPCENASSWAKILRDSENCATFACMTNLCLESQEHKCHQTHPWHCPSLDTAVQQLRLRKEPITMSPQAWNLEVDSLYWIGIPESGLQARVVKSADSPFPRLHISKSGVPEKTRARLGTMSRLFGPKMNRLREKQIETWPAEDVLILSQSK
ncbi:hypothetical protein V499_00298 [Pseudogymnoascus sp. VKM F-103]|nr:hypothetical protein V499_00298 [Pseudogymnoascus sp. VKM F-103]